MPEFTILIDGACPLCAREAGLMRRMNERFLRTRPPGASAHPTPLAHQGLEIIDIADPAFEPAKFNRTIDQLMGTIHGMLPDGTLITGMEVFRRAYAAVGWGWLLAPTAWPIVRPIADLVYAFFAKHRLRLTGRRHCATDRCAPHLSPTHADRSST